MTDNNRLYGGASRDRTDDPLLAKQVLSQLSYGPKLDLPLMPRCCRHSVSHIQMYAPSFIPSVPCLRKKLVGLGGFEPPTSPLSGVRSNQLSYRPGVTVCRSGSYEQQMHGRYTAKHFKSGNLCGRSRFRL